MRAAEQHHGRFAIRNLVVATRSGEGDVRNALGQIVECYRERIHTVINDRRGRVAVTSLSQGTAVSQTVLWPEQKCNRRDWLSVINYRSTRSAHQKNNIKL